MPARINLRGRRFGRWQVLKVGEMRGVRRHWLCRCDCGTEREVDGANLRQGLTTGCGCARGLSSITHGASRRGQRTRTYNAWRAMKTRALNPQYLDQKNYGHVTVDPRWLKFENFLADMGECPSGLSLDRIDRDKGYEPGNCRWADRATQNRNTSRNRWVSLKGERMVLKDAARAMGVGEASVYNTMKRHGLELQAAIDRMAARRLG